MQHINETLKNKKVISKSFICPRCNEDQCFTFWSEESKKTKWRCGFCFLEDFLHNLSFRAKEQHI